MGMRLIVVLALALLCGLLCMDGFALDVAQINNVTVISDNNTSFVLLPDGIYATQFPGNGSVLLGFYEQSNFTTTIVDKWMMNNDVSFSCVPGSAVVINPEEKLNFSEIDLAGNKTFFPGGLSIGKWGTGRNMTTLIYFDNGAIVVYDHIGKESLIRVSPRLDPFLNARFNKVDLTRAGRFNDTWMVMMESPGYLDKEEIAMEQ